MTSSPFTPPHRVFFLATLLWIEASSFSAVRDNAISGRQIASQLWAVEPTMESAHKSSTTADDRHAHAHKRWGVDNSHAEEYWFDRRIHTLGNCGFMGALHAAMAPISTKIIDMVAYDGLDIRKEVAKELSQKVGVARARVIDLCCGVGISTRALRDAFPEADTILGIDTSPEMLAMANFLTRHLGTVKPLAEDMKIRLSTGYTVVKEKTKKLQQKASNVGKFAFFRGNAEDTRLPGGSFDLVTVMYAFHEAPKEGRDKILREAYRLLRAGGTLAVIDISSDYTPSESMLAGEPYVLEYQQNIHDQLKSCAGFTQTQCKHLVPGHVSMWTLERTGDAAAAA